MNSYDVSNVIKIESMWLKLETNQNYFLLIFVVKLKVDQCFN